MILFGMHEAYFYLILFRIFFNIIDDLNKVDFLRSFQDVFFFVACGNHGFSILLELFMRDFISHYAMNMFS